MLSLTSKQKIMKTLVIEDEQSQKVKILTFELPLFEEQISLR